MRKYELMMIVSPTLTADEHAVLIESVEKELTDTGAKIATREDMGVRNLAYKIRTSTTGHYYLYTLETEESVSFFAVTNSFNIRKDIWRFMFTRIED